MSNCIGEFNLFTLNRKKLINDDVIDGFLSFIQKVIIIGLLLGITMADEKYSKPVHPGLNYKSVEYVRLSFICAYRYFFFQHFTIVFSPLLLTVSVTPSKTILRATISVTKRTAMVKLCLDHTVFSCPMVESRPLIIKLMVTLDTLLT